MRTKLNFCGIVEHSPKVLSFGKTQIYLFFRSLTRTFATAFIAATIILVSSCSQDDDYYESDMYTMAEKLETRAGEGGGGESGYMKILAGTDTFYYENLAPVILELIVSWPEGYFGMGHPIFSPSLNVNFHNELDIDRIKNLQYEVVSTQIDWFGGSSVKGDVNLKIHAFPSFEVIGETKISFNEAVHFETE